MNDKYQPVRIEKLKISETFVHAFSPRSIRLDNGETQELDFGAHSMPGAFSRDANWFLGTLDIEEGSIFRVRQTHSDRVHIHSSQQASPTSRPEADAIITSLVNAPIAIFTADCIPIVIYDFRLHVAGVVHAGRKGTAMNLLSKTVAALKSQYASRPENLIVGMGPGICGLCYEVNEDDVEIFRQRYRHWNQWVKSKPGGKFYIDLFAANREDALEAGMKPGNIHLSGYCTSCHNDRFFSYRKEQTPGRMMTLAMLRAR